MIRETVNVQLPTMFRTKFEMKFSTKLGMRALWDRLEKGCGRRRCESMLNLKG